METDNELIAEFMGGFNYSDDTKHLGMSLPFKSNIWSDYGDMQFSTSLDWLIPAFKLLCNKLRMTNWNTRELMEWANAQRGRLERKFWDYINDDCSQDDLVKEITEVIKWYNTQNL